MSLLLGHFSLILVVKIQLVDVNLHLNLLDALLQLNQLPSLSLQDLVLLLHDGGVLTFDLLIDLLLQVRQLESVLLHDSLVLLLFTLQLILQKLNLDFFDADQSSLGVFGCQELLFARIPQLVHLLLSVVEALLSVLQLLAYFLGDQRPPVRIGVSLHLQIVHAREVPRIQFHRLLIGLILTLRHLFKVDITELWSGARRNRTSSNLVQRSAEQLLNRGLAALLSLFDVL